MRVISSLNEHLNSAIVDPEFEPLKLFTLKTTHYDIWKTDTYKTITTHKLLLYLISSDNRWQAVNTGPAVKFFISNN